MKQTIVTIYDADGVYDLYKNITRAIGAEIVTKNQYWIYIYIYIFVYNSIISVLYILNIFVTYQNLHIFSFYISVFLLLC